jgi:hypothetical protein
VGELNVDALDIGERPLWETDKALWNKLTPDMKRKFEKWHGDTPTQAKPQLSPSAEKERDFVYQQHFQPTPEELEGMSMGEYIRFRSLQADHEATCAEPGPSLAEPPGEKRAEPDIPTLEAMSDEEYAAWVLSREAQ